MQGFGPPYRAGPHGQRDRAPFLVGISRQFRHMLELGPPGKVPSLVMAGGECLWDGGAFWTFCTVGRPPVVFATPRAAEAPPGTARRGGSRGSHREGIRARHRIRPARARRAGSHMDRTIGTTDCFCTGVPGAAASRAFSCRSIVQCGWRYKWPQLLCYSPEPPFIDPDADFVAQ